MEWIIYFENNQIDYLGNVIENIHFKNFYDAIRLCFGHMELPFDIAKECINRNVLTYVENNSNFSFYPLKKMMLDKNYDLAIEYMPVNKELINFKKNHFSIDVNRGQSYINGRVMSNGGFCLFKGSYLDLKKELPKTTNSCYSQLYDAYMIRKKLVCNGIVNEDGMLLVDIICKSKTFAYELCTGYKDSVDPSLKQVA